MRLKDGRLEVEVVPDPAQDHVELPHHELEQVDLALQHSEDAVFDCPDRGQVGQKDFVVLADAVYAAQPLLDLHRVPGEIEVQHDVTELQVSALARRFGGEEHGN